MTSFAFRSNRKELLDGPDIPFSDIRQNMLELRFINRHLGGHSTTIEGVSRLIPDQSRGGVEIVELGSGGGDNLQVIASWCRSADRQVQLTGIDKNKSCITYAEDVNRHSNIKFIHADFRDISFESKPHIIFSSLFTHHFTDEEIIPMLKWMHANSRAGFFINDLHRCSVAYYSIRALTSIFSKSDLVKHDAPLSVLRAFKRADWNCLFEKAGVPLTACVWKWAFRWLVISKHAY